MPSIGYFPGCSLSGTAAEYDRSLRAVAAALNVDLAEVPDWVCCGATSAHAIDHGLARALAADTLAKARRAGHCELLAPCAMCYSRLAAAARELAGDHRLRRTLLAAMGESDDLDLHGVRPVNLLQWFERIGHESIQARVTAPLNGLKVACYYGCLLVRPASVTGEREVEAPRSMEKLLTLLGAQPVRWSMALECCAGSFALSRKEAVLRQGRRIYDAARRAGAEVICLACPMCHSNLDLRQGEFGVPRDDRLPVVYLTQLVGLALGRPREQMGFDGLFVDVNRPAALSA
ncbi:MAG: heterodisulfide reductase subunit B [Phycisphaerae bacterium]